MTSELSKPEIQRFIEEHLYDDPASLMLKAKRYPHLPMARVVEQIQSKRKAKTKLPQWFANKGIIYPSKISMEQCSSEAVALYKAGLVKGETMIDLTGGFGVDAYFLSKGFNRVDYLEQQRELAEMASHNFSSLRATHIQVHQADSLAFLKKNDDFYTLIYADPARRGSTRQKVFRFEDCEPRIIEQISFLKARCRTLMIKASPMLDLKQGIQSLGGATEVHVVSVQNEVKELLFILDEYSHQNPPIHCVNLKSGCDATFTFTFEEERQAQTNPSAVKAYLYEPNASILKAGGFNAIARACSIDKLHPNTHLYTSHTQIEPFPGKTFKVLAKASMDKKQLRELYPSGKVNITVRNFPLTVARIRKKTGLKEGGEAFLFGLTDKQGPKLLHCQKV